MLRKLKKPFIEISDKESIFAFSPPSPTSYLFRIGEKKDILSLLLKIKTKTKNL